MKNKRTKKITILILTAIVLGSILFIKFYNNNPTPTELENLRQEIEQNNQGQNFDLDYEYTGPNTHQPLPFNYE